ncbi:MAG TPA: endonuclease/exonuclease/phosphatase family protein [bacterium]|nr:endonuclease/exonuclease/phosphatase family protein [bacterium]HPI78744.1 endonuclease/exonuclease/phosphatase family protein [bacterium]
MKTRTLIIFSFIVILAARPLSAAESHTTYFSANILYCDLQAGEKRDDYASRREALIALLAEMKPDIVGIQEASVCKIYGHPSGDDTIKEIALGLKKRGLNYGASFWESERVGSLWIEGLAFMWNRETVALDKANIKCRHLETSYQRSGALIQKSLCRADATAKDGGAPLRVYNTHFEAYKSDARIKQSLEVAAILREESADPNARALFGGDLNSRDMSGTYEAEGFKTVAADRVDYVFSIGISDEDIRAEIVPLHSLPEASDISDHNGILVTIRNR